jgi:hypothetical protein
MSCVLNVFGGYVDGDSPNLTNTIQIRPISKIKELTSCMAHFAQTRPVCWLIHRRLRRTEERMFTDLFAFTAFSRVHFIDMHDAIVASDV